MTYRGHVENGTVVFDEAVALPEGAAVQVDVLDDEVVAGENGPTLYERLKPVIGAAKGLPPDLARNHDHYLHGQPKK
jgi:hypothetical protein